MDQNFLQGNLVRLTVEEPKDIAELVARWDCDSEYFRLLATDPSSMYSVKKVTEWTERQQLENRRHIYMFAIRTLETDQLVGFIDLSGDGELFPSGDAFVGIGIGEREAWGKGYGTDAMRIILRYAFQELNLRRVTLDTFEYNPRAIRSYEKAGFVHEGRQRSFLLREGKRWDLVHMGILREEWLANSAMTD